MPGIEVVGIDVDINRKADVKNDENELAGDDEGSAVGFEVIGDTCGSPILDDGSRSARLELWLVSKLYENWFVLLSVSLTVLGSRL